MKVRNGFVSNSSSSSFIVEVPKDLSATEDNLRNSTAFDRLRDDPDAFIDEDTEDINLVKFVDKMNEHLQLLRNGNTLYAGYDHRDPESQSLFWPMYEFLSSENCVVMSVDGAGGDGDDTIIPFKDERKK